MVVQPIQEKICLTTNFTHPKVGELHMKMITQPELVVDPTWTGIQLMKVWDLSNKQIVIKKCWFYKQMECLCPKTNVGLYQHTLVSLATNTKYHQELLVLIILVT